MLNPVLIKANDTRGTVEGGTMLMSHLSESVEIKPPSSFLWVSPQQLKVIFTYF